MKNEAVLSKGTSNPAILWLNRYNFFLRFLLEGSLAGIVAGTVGIAFRLVLTEIEIYRNNILIWAHSIPAWGWLILPFLGVLAGGLAGWLTTFAPETAGSGIPHVEAVLMRQQRLVWWRIIPVKFIAGALAIGAGLSLGREGPTVQMGAAAGQAVSKSLMRTKAEELQLIACGAGAGLAAAFNAPLAGVVFVLEELRRNFSPYVLGGALTASIAADLISQKILGPLPTFQVKNLLPLPLTTLPLFVILGVATGVLGASFNRALQGGLELADKLTKVPRWLRAALVAVLAGVVGYFLPEVLGGGHFLVESVLANKVALQVIPLLFIAKFLLTIMSYSAGVPGGIFLPLLVLGTLIGSFIGQISGYLFPSLQGMAPSFAIVSMAAYFVAIVRAPLTGIVLIIEMTGHYQHMLPLLLTCVVAYIVAEALGTLPIYEMLLERDLMKGRSDGEASLSCEDKTTVIEVVVESGSPASGCRVKDLKLPSECLLVSVNRGTREIIPRGSTKLLEGDHLKVIVPEGKAGKVIEEFDKLTRCRVRNRVSSS
ncbi:chloride channel protein, CIC family [Thermanaeromonas toyohensis ToBE]|uniref:Chloride channel protein, CIC family n=1 Tax=Thermanaeromonas toyohensis ToBE TaxID=698762 RepID=A0A1W1VZ86_9FIRM|nr:H(+)/Cl(-) exchange transporter ClcA [Thermanaeromonas toyohensis]SMB98675.1 chloride channel protein, CIC family [Thermanaeromonas toyohensis ToBE]